MLKEILSKIGSGCTSVCELADSLGMDKQDLIRKLQQLIRDGYVDAQEKQRCSVCSKGCPGCGMAGSPEAGVTLSLTEKGRESLNKQG
jgi:DNA-binding IclR family transcriptional regulator